MPRSFFQPAKSAGGINMNPTVWLNEARPAPKYIFKNNMSLHAKMFDQLRNYDFTLKYLNTSFYAIKGQCYKQFMAVTYDCTKFSYCTQSCMLYSKKLFYLGTVVSYDC
jgi:hypothetical protein